MSSKSVIYHTFSCDLEDCTESVISTLWHPEAERQVRRYGWRRALATSPVPGAGWGWAITIHFCPKHSGLADKPDTWAVKPGTSKAPSYTIRLAG